MTVEPKLRPLFATLIGLAAMLLVAGCSSGTDPVDAPAPSAAGSLAEISPATNGEAVIDAPTFPEVTESETKLKPPPIVPGELEVVWEAWELLREDYVDRSKLDPEAFSEFAIRGMLRVLEDAQTAYVSPEVLAGSFSDTFRGAFEGIGAYVQMTLKGELIISHPIEGSPAEAAGIKAGDVVLEADGESLEGLSVLEAVAKIRGPGGSIVKLLVKHLGAIDPILIEVTRGTITLPSVLLRSEPGDPFAHIRITQFYPNTLGPLKETIQTSIDGGAKGLILDLRGNPGGTLDAVVDVASLFINEGLVLYVEKGDGTRTNWAARPDKYLTDIPMVLLVNAGSGSSSEVLAGALQDHERAVVIGDTTFGKGSVNILRRLSNDAGLYITIAYWYTPDGRLIQSEGIIPDIEVVDRDSREADIKQLRRAYEELERITGVKSSKSLG